MTLKYDPTKKCKLKPSLFPGLCGNIQTKQNISQSSANSFFERKERTEQPKFFYTWLKNRWTQ